MPNPARIVRLARPLLTCALALLVAAAASAQDDEKKKRDPKLQEQIETFEDAISDRKFERDQEAVELAESFGKRYPDLHPKDQQDVLEALRKVFRVRPRKPEDPRLYDATITTLGTIGGPHAARILVRQFDRKPFTDEEWMATREKILENVGRTKDERQIEFLLDNATRAPIDNVMRAAGYALRHFSDAEGKVRRDIFEKLLIRYAEVEGNARSGLDTNSSAVATFQATLNAIADPWNQTLSALSGARLRTAEQWQDWWNDNKNDRKVWK